MWDKTEIDKCSHQQQPESDERETFGIQDWNWLVLDVRSHEILIKIPSSMQFIVCGVYCNGPCSLLCLYRSLAVYPTLVPVPNGPCSLL